MKLKHSIKYIGAPSRTIIYLMLFAAGVTILQFIIPGVILISFPKEYKYQSEWPKVELTEAERQQRRIDQARKEFLPDGTFHLLSESRKENDGTYWHEIQVQDINGNLLWKGKEKDLPYEYLSWPGYRSIGYNAKEVTKRIITPVFSRVLVIPALKGQINRYWRYEPGKHYFVGVDAKGRKVGYAGSNGFQEFRNQVEPFEEVKCIDAWCPRNYYSPVLLWQTEHQFYEIDFKAHSVELIFDTKDKEISRVFMFNWFGIEDYHYYRNRKIDTNQYRPVMRMETTSGEHYLLLRDPNEQVVFRTPKNWDRRETSIAATKGKIYLRYEGAERRWSGPYQKLVELYQIENDGNLKFLNRFEWTPPQQYYQFKSRDKYQDSQARYLKKRYYVKTVSSPLLDLALLWSYKRMTYSGKCRELYDFIATLIDEDNYYLMTNRPANLALSLLMVCFAFWHGWSRRASSGKLFAWLVIVGAFNLAGLLTYLALNHTAIIKCPVCGKWRGLERVDCVRCGAELPAPEQRKLDLIFNA